MNDDIKWKIDTEIEKDKRVTELKCQNQILKEANDYLQEKINEISKNVSINHYHSENVELRRINNQLQSNWNSLREWVQSEYNRYLNDTENLIHSNVEVIDFSRMLDKMNELEGKDKE